MVAAFWLEPKWYNSQSREESKLLTFITKLTGVVEVESNPRSVWVSNSLWYLPKQGNGVYFAYVK